MSPCLPSNRGASGMSRPYLPHTSSCDDLLEYSPTALREKHLHQQSHAMPPSKDERYLPQSANSERGTKPLLAACVCGAGVSICTITFHQRGDINIISCAAVAFTFGAACAAVILLCNRATPRAISKLALLSRVGSVLLAAAGVVLLGVAVARIDPQSLPKYQVLGQP